MTANCFLFRSLTNIFPSLVKILTTLPYSGRLSKVTAFLNRFLTSPFATGSATASMTAQLPDVVAFVITSFSSTFSGSSRFQLVISTICNRISFSLHHLYFFSQAYLLLGLLFHQCSAEFLQALALSRFGFVKLGFLEQRTVILDLFFSSTVKQKTSRTAALGVGMDNYYLFG